MRKIGSGGNNRIVEGNPFASMTEQAQYWLGFLAADGNVSTKKNAVSLAIKDIEHVLKYKHFISSALSEYYRINAAGSTICQITFGNKETKDFLISIGITPNKSKTFKFSIPITGHILRGVFDGDGSVSQNRPKITTGSLYFKKQLEDFYNTIGIKFTTTVKHKIKDRNVFDIWILKESKQDFYNLLYNNATVFLERKKLQYEGSEYKRKSRKKQKVNSGEV